MVLRSVDDGNLKFRWNKEVSIFVEKGKVENVKQSVQLAKEAVAVDLKDGDSWCNFFEF